MRILRWLLFSIAALLLIAVTGTAVAAFLMLQNQPVELPGAVPQKAQVNQLDIMQLGTVTDNATLELELSEAELNQLVQQQIEQSFPNVNARVMIRITPGAARIDFSGALPVDIERRYLNVLSDYSVGASLAQISLDNLQIGTLQIPAWLRAVLIPYVLEYCHTIKDCRAALAAYKNITLLQLGKGSLRLQYALEPGGLSTPGQQDFAGEVERLTPYVQELTNLVQERQDSSLSLHDALRRVFSLAQRQSVLSNDPVAENRSALLALATMGADSRVLDLLNMGALRNQVEQLGSLKLRGRKDLAQHFLTSAALYLLGGSELSEYLGIYKELSDVDNGKLFGVGDLVADRVGIRVARQATASRSSALQLQSQLITANSVDDYLLTNAVIEQLTARYNASDSVDVAKLSQRIDQSIAELPLFQ